MKIADDTSMIPIREGERGTCLDFAVLTHLKHWDEEVAASLVENESSFLYRYDGIPVEDMRLFYEALFVKKTVRARLCAAFRVKDMSVMALRDEKYCLGLLEYLPNPHFHFYGDMGVIGKSVNRFLESGDLDLALEQCAACAGCLNISDTVVTGMFCDIVWNRRNGINNVAFDYVNEKRDVLSPAGVIARLKRLRK